jgi:hypothetical protein
VTDITHPPLHLSSHCRESLSGGLDPDHDDKLLWGYNALAGMLSKSLENNPRSVTRSPSHPLHTLIPLPPPSRLVDIQAYLNTIYFIIAEISSFDSPSSQSTSNVLAQLRLLLSSHPYLTELLQTARADQPQSTTVAHLLIYEYKFYKYLCNYHQQLQHLRLSPAHTASASAFSSQLYLYLHRLYLLWTSLINSKQGNDLQIVLSIEETNMNPLYDPYREMIEDLDAYGLYSCQLGYYDHVQYEQQSGGQAERDTLHGTLFDDIKFHEIVPLDGVEEGLLRESYQSLPSSLMERVRNGQKAAELAIHFYDLVTDPLLPLSLSLSLSLP